MSLRFAGGSSSIDPQLSADIQSLDKLLSDEQLSQFVDIIVGFFLAPADTDLMGGIRQFASAHGVNARALKSSMRGILVFFQGLIKHGLTQAQVVEDCAQLGLRDSAAQLLAQKWNSSRGGLAHVSTGRTLRVNELVDMEWKFGVTASSHELQTVGSTFLQLRLVIDKGGGERESKLMEPTLPQFYQFLMQMEKAKSQLDFLTA